MVGLIEFTEGPGKHTAVREQLGGMDCLRLNLCGGKRKGEFRQRREVRWMRRMFSSWGVKHILVPEGSSLGDAFEQSLLVDFAPFNRGIADLLALGWLDQRGLAPKGAVVGLSAPRMSYEVRQTAQLLAGRVKGLRIDVPGEGAVFANWLHREYGIPIREGGQADVSLLFVGEKRGEGPWIDLSERGGIPAGLRVTAPELKLPPLYEEQILALMWGRGGLARSQIRVIDRKSVGFPLDKRI